MAIVAKRGRAPKRKAGPVRERAKKKRAGHLLTGEKKRIALISLVVISGVSMVVLLGVFIYASIAERPLLETSIRSAFEMCTLAFTVLLGVLLAAPQTTVGIRPLY
jgi:hypothetical protein